MKNLRKLSLKLLPTLLVAALLSVTSMAVAGGGLASSHPSKGQMLNKAPTQLTLNFDHAMLLLAVSLKNGKQQPVAMNFKAVPDLKKSFKVALPTLAVDNYYVSWTAMGSDGHKMSGSFDFMVHQAGMNHDHAPGHEHHH